MADFISKSGIEINFDFDQITVAEYRSIFDPKQAAKLDDTVIEKVCGVDAGFILALTVNENKRLFKAFLKKASAPVDETPNLESGSTLP
jgi:hypothetical protein